MKTYYQTKFTLKERFESKIELIPFTDCWIWNSSLNDNGYGQIHNRGKTLKAHKVSYELYKGIIPKGMCVCHTCDNRYCVNPNHLWLGTYKDNINDMFKKNRQNLKRSNKLKLTAKQILEIKINTTIIKQHLQKNMGFLNLQYLICY